MSSQLVELAIRSRKQTVGLEEFVQMKDTAVKSLVRIKGVGPEHEYNPLTNIPEREEIVYIGTTRYNSFGSFVRACFSITFVSNLIKFLKMCDLITGVFLKPENKDFDYVKFATKENIVELSILRPKAIGKKAFFEARETYLTKLSKEKEVKSTHAFKTKFGFANSDVIVHFCVYKNQEAFESFAKRASSIKYIKDFNLINTPLIISACEMLK